MKSTRKPAAVVAIVVLGLALGFAPTGSARTHGGGGKAKAKAAHGGKAPLKHRGPKGFRH